MSLPEHSVGRPIGVLMTTVAVAVFGFLAARGLPIELLPDMSYPTLTVQTEYADAAPVSVEQFVTRPVEEAVGVIQGVRDMRSVSRAGLSEVVLEFDWGEEMEFAAMEVREKLNLVELPMETEPPRVLRFDPSLDPIVRLAFEGDRPLDELRQLAERWLKPRLESVTGVAAARVRGGLDPEIVVEADEDSLATFGLTLADLGAALEAENVNTPGGVVRDWGAVYLVRTLHEFEDLEQLERTVVRDTEAGRIRVEDVAKVYRGHRDRDEITRSGGEETIEIALYREGSANTVQVAENIRSELVRIRGDIRGDLTITELTDQSGYISAAVSEVWTAALIGGFLAIIVLYFFLRDPSSTGIIALAIPISVIATFLPMSQAGVTLNIMSLGGLALGVGMLMDNAIVVLEAIDRRRREGLSRAQAAIRGASEVAGAVTAATLTTVSVFLPIVFVEGVAGQLFFDLAVTVCLSLVASLIVSLTVIPALAGLEVDSESVLRRGTLFRFDEGVDPSARLPHTLPLGGVELRPIGNGRHWASIALTWLLLPIRLPLALVFLAVALAGRSIDALFRVMTWPFARLIEAIGALYPGALRASLRARWGALPLAVLLFVLSVLGLAGLGTDLVPDLAQGEFAFQLRMPEGTPIDSAAQIVAAVEGPLVEDPAFARVFSVIGSLPSTASGRQTTGENLAQINFVLPEGSDAAAESAAVNRVRSVLSLFDQVEAELVRPSVLSMKPPVAVQIFADNLDELTRGAATIEAELEQVSGLRDVASTAEPGSPEIRIVPDRERAAALGLDSQTLATALRSQIRGDLVGEFREGEERIDIRLRVDESSRDRASSVDALRVRLPNGSVVPIAAIATVEQERGPAAIHRASGARMAEITAQTSGGALGPILDQVSERVSKAPLPPEVVVEMAGQDKELALSLDSLKLALALAVFLVYVVMAVQFESLVHPFVILLSVPLGIVGVVAALLLTGTSVNVLVLIGAVMLAGIVVNNAIVLIDAINRRRRKEGQALQEAILGAGTERLRPILMTTATTVLGLTPMAFGIGEGSELRTPLAITVIGGLVVATLLTLIVIPCLYRVFSRAEESAESEEGLSALDPAGTEARGR